MDYISVLSVVGGILSPIIVAVIGLRAEVATRNSKKAQELNKKEKDLEKKQLDDKLNAISAGIENVTKKLGEMEKQIQDLSDHNDEQDEAIRALNRSTRLNGQYVHELAQLVMVLSEGMRDQHLDGNITRAINDYRKFEADALNSLLTSGANLDDH